MSVIRDSDHGLVSGSAEFAWFLSYSGRKLSKELPDSRPGDGQKPLRQASSAW